MEKDFTRSFPRARQLLAFVIDLAQVLRLQEPLAHHGRRAQDLAVIEPITDVAIVGGSKAFGVDPAADIADLFFDLVFVHEIALAVVDRYLVKQTSTIRIYRFLLWMK